MNTFISYSEYKKEYALNETYESYVELNQLAKDIFDAYQKKKISINTFYYIQSFTKRKYSVINDLIKANIGIIIVTSKKSSFGAFCEPKYYTTKKEYQYLNGYIIIYNGELYFSTLMHELQHAYDYIRSKGKYVNTKMGNKQEKFLNARASASISNIDDLKKSYKKIYYRTPHEKSAIFVGTLSEINFFLDEEEIILKDFRTVYEEFKEKYKGYDYLTPKDKKILLRKFSQYYYKLKERNITKE